MSAIDSYQHECLGMARCDSSYSLVPLRDLKSGETQWIPLYRLLEDVPENETDFDGKKGDVLMGGGGGETPALRISVPNAFYFWTGHEEGAGGSPISSLEMVVKPYWSMTWAFQLCEGFQRMGWDVKSPIESWLLGHILAFLAKNYSKDYEPFIGPDSIEESGEICRLPTPEEMKIYTNAQAPK